MARKYDHIWKLLKEADIDQWVEVKVRHVDQIQTVINMVQVTKSQANVSHKALNLPAYGKLEIRREPEQLKVFFRLKNAGAML